MFEKLKNIKFETLVTNRLEIKPLGLTNVNNNYLNWINNPEENPFIISTNKNMSIDSLKKYVITKLNTENLLFLGIFEKTSGLHIGNIKYMIIIITSF